MRRLMLAMGVGILAGVSLVGCEKDDGCNSRNYPVTCVGPREIRHCDPGHVVVEDCRIILGRDDAFCGGDPGDAYCYFDWP